MSGDRAIALHADADHAGVQLGALAGADPRAAGVTDHHVSSEAMLDHIVELVEKKAAELESATTDFGGASQA